MKFILHPTILLLALFLTSCGGDKNASDPENADMQQNEVAQSAFNYDTLKGSYRGDFGDSPIGITLTYVSESHATGYNVVKGKRRNISGTVQRIESGVLLTLAEPGDDAYDGVFKIKMRDEDQTKIFGEWESKNGEVKTFSLTRIDHKDYEGQAPFGTYNEVFTDSLGTLYFEYDGTARYEYYENEGLANEQQKKIIGSWKLDGEKVNVFWPVNPIFNNRKSVFNIGKMSSENDEDPRRILIGENREFSELYY